MPSTSSTVAVVESRPRGDRTHGGPRSLNGESPCVCISVGAAALLSCLTQRHLEYCLFVRLAHNASICSLARYGRTTPSASTTVAVVESQRRGDRGDGVPRPCLIWRLVPETQRALKYYTSHVVNRMPGPGHRQAHTTVCGSWVHGVRCSCGYTLWRETDVPRRHGSPPPLPIFPFPSIQYMVKRTSDFLPSAFE